MNAALQRRLAKIEATHPATRIIVEYPDVVVSFVTAEPAYPNPPESYPQPYQCDNQSYPQPVDKSEKPTTIIELSAGEDLNMAAAELGISADELHRQINSGLVQIIDPPLQGKS